jgi:hypothetical protein
MYTIDVPGSVTSYLSGSSAVQGQPYSEDPEIERGAQELCTAYGTARRISRGRGFSLRLELPSREAVIVLDEYAEMCIESNLYGDPEPAELRAARQLRVRCAEAIGQPVPRW